MMWMTMMIELRKEGIRKKLTDDKQQEVYSFQTELTKEDFMVNKLLLV